MNKIIKNKYFQVGVISFLLISIMYILKGIFPFGNKLAMWSDLHEQITPMYYKFYDAVYGNSSLLVDYSTGGGINLVGIFSYYIMSPFTLIVLLFPREQIFEATSLIIMAKMIAASLTSFYFLNTFFKKLTNNQKILLSLLYTFSVYSLFYYVITGWMDGMYLFPLLLVGLKKILDLEGNIFYVITLTLSLIFSFYTALLSLLFIFFSSYFYLKINKKDKIKTRIYNLGIYTLIALLISGVTIIPTYYELISSARARMDFSVILNSKLGPLVDKISLFLASAPLIIMTLLNYKKRDNFVKVLFIGLSLTMVPVLIEPINKMLHFGSYMYLPLRFAYIPIFLLVIGSAYYLENKKEIKKSKECYLGVIFTLLTVIVSLFSYKYFDTIRRNINKLSLSYDKKMFIILFLVFILTSISLYFILKRENKYNKLLLNFIIIFNLLFNMSIYIGGYKEPELRNDYVTMNELAKLNLPLYRAKLLKKDLVMNFGMVTKISTYTQFTSMVDKINYDTMQRFGYDAYSMDTEAIGGNLFIDTVLGNKYILTYKNDDIPYYNKINSINNLNIFEHNKDISFGYRIKSNKINLEKDASSFENSNVIYNAITNSNDNIFEITKINKNNIYKKGEVIEQKIKINEKSNLYLEMFRDFDFQDKNKIYKSFNIYVNDELIEKEYPNIDINGNVFLGEYKQDVILKIEVLKEAFIRRTQVGSMSLNKYDEFINREKNEVNVDYVKNKINVKVDGEEGEYLFLPITYLEGYKSTYKITRVFDNFLLIQLENGVNNISVSFQPKGLILGIIVSIIGVILLIIFSKYKILLFENVVYYIYITLFYILFFTVYLGGFLAFIISFVYRFK